MRFALPLLLLFVAGCASDSTSAQPTPAAAPTTQQAATTPPASAQDYPVYDDGHIDKGLPKTAAPGAKIPKDGDPIAIIDTNMGRIVLKFFPQKAPNHVKNFLDLAGKGFYDGTKFHRVIPAFMIQGGDPYTKTDDTSKWGTGGPGYTIKGEFSDMLHEPGILAMARSQDPDSAGSQFYIMDTTYQSMPNNQLDGNYTIFGQVIEGMDVVHKIATTPRDDMDRPVKAVVVKKVEVAKWPIKLNG